VEALHDQIKENIASSKNQNNKKKIGEKIIILVMYVSAITDEYVNKPIL